MSLPPKATHRQTRAYNNRLVLRTIYDRNPISRADLARATGLTRTTVSELVADMIGEGLTEEVGRGPSNGGKAPILLRFSDDARHLIGIDLGSSEFRGAVVNLRGQMRHSVGLPLQGRNGDDALELVFELIDQLVAATDRPLLGIGIGTPGIIDTATGTVRWAVNLDWQNLPLGRLLTERYDLPVYVANDSQAAALAQFTFGGGPHTGSMIVINVGHGIGAGIVLNGELFQGDGFGAGEIGHTVVREPGDRCRCGRHGCLETVASSRAVIQRTAVAAAETPASVLHRASGGGPLTLDQIHQAFVAEDPVAREVVLEAGRALGAAIASLVGGFNVHRIVLVGTMAVFGEPWLQAVCDEVHKRSLALLADQTQIEIGSLYPNVVVLGASALLMTRELGLSPARN